MKKVTVGLLPLYIKLYDDLLPSLRNRLDAFYETVASRMEQQGVTVLRAGFCRLESEFSAAVGSFEAQGADCIVTLHMAYSPSLESAQVLAKTQLPIVVLDTTQTYEFDFMQDPDEINYNHGIHGVMDMCNLLRRNGKLFAICAGHYEHSDVIARACGLARAAAAARSLRGSRVGVFGGNFNGMGDFLVTPEEMRERFGVEMIEAQAQEICRLRDSVTKEEIEAEMEADRARFDFPEELDEARYSLNTKACLTMRKWIEARGLSAFSVNFLKVSPSAGLDSMPFIEACKAMEKGIGYAGEGDALTAAISGALLGVFPETSFVEIFCPDWKNGNVMISHMGEMNYRLAAEKPQLRGVSFNYTDAEPPVVGYARFKGGKAVYANFCRDEEGYCLVMAPVEMLSAEKDNFPLAMRGWMRPQMPVERFLEELSRYGATHHSVLLYDVSAQQMEFFGKLLGMKVICLGN